MNLIRYRALISVVATAVLVVGVIATIVGYGWERYLRAQAVLEEIEPRHARLLGLKSVDAQLKKAVLDAYAQVVRWAYPPEQDVGKAANDVQQRARRVAEAAGMTIISSQALPPRVENGFEQIPVSVTLEGGVQSLQMALSSMSGETPVLFVDTLSLRAIDRGDAKQPQQVAATMVVMSLRIQP